VGRSGRPCLGLAYLESLGIKVRVMPNSGESKAGAQVSPQSRAQDLHAAFSDPDISVVLAAIGGDHAVELLPHRDYDLIRANPKGSQVWLDLRGALLFLETSEEVPLPDRVDA
jgi:muramoyltetrapeptide carboxypeptidase LdcA involved in peptidoglycan recycling